MNNAEKSKEEVVRDLKIRQEKFDRLQTELESVRRDANKAQGL
jgi:structural maintenance of chromosome 1